MGSPDQPAIKNFFAVMTVYLIGLLVGGLYVGIAMPVRTVIQADFGLDDSTGIWMITIYTLFYAALIPVIGNLADRHGRKRVFLVCIMTFCAGSVICGLTPLIGKGTNAFIVLLVGRVIQAVGACGVIPVANAEIGVSAPPDKRGMALGITAAVAGIANVLGSAVGSAIIAVVGAENWPVLFLAALPICGALFIAGIAVLPNHETKPQGKLDAAGAALMIVFVLALLLSFQEIDFSKLGSFTNSAFVAPFTIAVLALVLFWRVERKAECPVFNPAYLRSKPIVITMVVSFFIGCVIISMSVVTEYAEFVMHDPVGTGGFYVIAIGIFSFVGPPVGGKLVDRFGPKLVLMGGMGVMVVGYALLAVIAPLSPSPLMLIIALAVVGLGMGFSMGTPTNYMILENTSPEQSSSAIATITFVRQVGTSLGPAILISFIANGVTTAGFQGMMLCVAAFCAISVLVMIPYRSPRG